MTRGPGELVRSLQPRLPPRPTGGEVRLAIKMVVAGTLSWWLCTVLGQDRPLFAVLVPLVAMSGDPFSAVSVSVARTIGVFAGVFIGLGLLQLSLNSTLLVLILLVASLAVGLLLRARGWPINNQVAITAMFMLYLGVATKAQEVGVARIWETALGAGVAVAVSVLLWPPDPLAETRRRVARLHDWLRQDLARVAHLLRSPSADEATETLDLVRDRSLQAVQDVLEVGRGERALRWNPRRRRDSAAFTAERRRLTGAARQYRHLRTLARIAADAAGEEGPAVPAGERERLAEAVSVLAGEVTGGPAVSAPIDPATLDDPRSVGLAVKMRHMVDDLVAMEAAPPT